MGNITINTDDVLTPEEARLILKVGKNQMYKLLREDRLKHFKIGASIRIPKVCLEEYILSTLEEKYVDTSSKPQK